MFKIKYKRQDESLEEAGEFSSLAKTRKELEKRIEQNLFDDESIIYAAIYEETKSEPVRKKIFYSQYHFPF